MDQILFVRFELNIHTLSIKLNKISVSVTILWTLDLDRENLGNR